MAIAASWQDYTQTIDKFNPQAPLIARMDDRVTRPSRIDGGESTTFAIPRKNQASFRGAPLWIIQRSGYWESAEGKHYARQEKDIATPGLGHTDSRRRSPV